MRNSMRLCSELIAGGSHSLDLRAGREPVGEGRGVHVYVNVVS